MLVRKRTPEIMDDPGLDESLHFDALTGLGRLNMASAAHLHVTRCLTTCHRNSGTKPVRILDIATGGADIPFAISRFAKSSAIPIEIEACDISETALRFAEKRAKQEGLPIKFFKLDALNESLSQNYDLVMTSLFTHHLDPPDVVRLLSKMRGAARQAVLVDDLERSSLNLAMVTFASRLLARSPIVHHDGPASVRAAYTFDELLELAQEAGLKNAKIQRHFPCRLFVQDWAANA
jgi:2-polyprenyl-3-methyl-5-hydroxy-6-metoxy-1,4-benzoquinol methylase